MPWASSGLSGVSGALVLSVDIFSGGSGGDMAMRLANGGVSGVSGALVLSVEHGHIEQRHRRRRETAFYIIMTMMIDEIGESFINMFVGHN